MKVLYLTAGAAGMYCGSCMHDNTLAAALMRRGCDVSLVPLYTPIRTDEENVSVDRVFFGGINMYLQEKIPLFRHLPAFADRWLNNPRLIRRVAGGSMSVKASELGALTLSALRGEHGHQRKEMRRLVDWIKKEARPEIVNLTNLLVAGFVPLLKKEYDVPVLVTLQGDDLFLEELEAPHKEKVMAEMRRLAAMVDGFVVNTRFYAAKMAALFEVPVEKMHLVPLGSDVTLHPEALRAGQSPKETSGRPTVGYLARICPEKGFGLLVDAFIRLRQLPGMGEARLVAAGWLGNSDREFFEAQRAKLREVGLEKAFEYAGVVDREEKIEFLRSVDVFSVPATYEEPKGLFVLEALACGIPVVQPEHGAFPELLERTGGGKLFAPNDTVQLARTLADLLGNTEARKSLGAEGKGNVIEHCGADAMAGETLRIYEHVLGERAGNK